MVLLSQIGALAGFTYTSWKIIGQWYRFRTKNEERQDDGYIFKALESAVAAAKSDPKSGRSKHDYGAAAAASGHAHVLAEFQRMPLAMRVQLVEDLARLAEWSGQANKSVARLRKRGGWKKLSLRERGRLLGAVDALDFSFTETIKHAGTDAAAQAWVWQLTEALPLLAAEPEAIQEPLGKLGELQARFTPLEVQVRAMVDARRAELLRNTKQAVEPITVAAAVRNLQLLREALVGDLGIDSRKSARGTAALTSLLDGPLSELAPRTDELRSETADAEAALADEGRAAADAARDAALPGVERAARSAYVRELIAAASAPALWSSSSSSQSERPVANSNAALRRVALTEAVLAELGSATEGEAGVEELLEAARKLVPRLLPELGLVKGPEAVPEKPEEKPEEEDLEPTGADGEKRQEGEEGEEDEAREPAPQATPPPKPKTAGDEAHDALFVLDGTASPGVAREAARRLSKLLAEAAEQVLPRPASASTRYTDDELVARLAASAVRNVLAASGAQVDESEVLDRTAVRQEAVAAADAASAQVQQAELARVEAAAAAARDKATSEGLSERLAKLDDQSAGVRFLLAKRKLGEARNATYVADATAQALSVLQDDDLAALPASTAAAVRFARDVAERVQLASEVATGLELGPGLTALLEKIDGFLESRLQTREEAEEEEEGEEEKEEGEEAEEEGEEGEGKEEEGEAAQEQEGGEEGERERVVAADAKQAAAKAVKEAVAAAAPPLDSTAARGARGLVSELLGEGLVLLELGGAATKKLRTLRETVEGLQPNMEPQAWSRGITALKDLVSQLGPIGAAVDARLNDVQSEERRQLLLGLRGTAIGLYRCLMEFLDHDGKEVQAVQQSLAAMKSAVNTLKVDRRVATLAALAEALDSLAARQQELAERSRNLASIGSGATASAAKVVSQSLETIGACAEALSEAAAEYGQYSKLREHALGTVPPTCPQDIEVPEFSSLGELQVDHAEDVVWLDMVASEEEDQNGWCMAGFKLVARGQVAVVLVADGVDAEKRANVTLDIGLPSTKPLLQLYAERLRRIQRLAAEGLYGQGAAVQHPTQWYIMATPATRPSIVQCLQSNSYFGLQPGQVHVFAPDLTVPVLGEDMKVAMEAPFKIARAQGGSGELFRGLRESGMLAHMRRNGVRCLDVHAVEDNIMAKIADPIFLGYCHSIHLDCAAKVIDPDSVQMTTYGYAHAAGILPGDSELEEGPVADALPHMMPAIGQYYLSVPWVVQVDAALSRNPLALYRLTPANVPMKGGAKAPGYRPERTLTDFVLGLPNHVSSKGARGGEGEEEEGEVLVPEQQSGLVIVDAGEQFSAVWGRAPFYAPETANAAVEDLLLQHTYWVEGAGGTLADEEEGVVEVSPLVSYSGECLEDVAGGREFSEAYNLDLQGFGAGAAGALAGGRHRTNMGLWMAPFLGVYALLAAAKVATSLR